MYAGRRHHSPVRAVCSLCAQDIYAGETLWYRNGVTVCADCFPRFAREALRSFEYMRDEQNRQKEQPANRQMGIKRAWGISRAQKP